MTEYFIYEKGHAHLTVQERPAQEIFEINRPKIRHKLEDTESIKVSSQQLRKQKNSASDDMTYEEATEYSSLLSATRNELLGKSLTGDDVVYKPSSTMHSRGKSSTEDKMIHKSASGRSAVWKDNKKGKVNVYLWEAVCPSPENDKVLHWHPLFPKYPTYSYLLENLDDPDWIIKKVARRIIGYLHPKITGHYEFQINSRDDMELFLYNGQWFEGQTAIIKMGIYAADRAEQDKIIGQYDLFSKTSDSVFLEKGKKYAIEIFHGIINFGRMNVRWKLQNGKNDFEIINSSYISSLYSNQTLNVDMPVPKFAPINKLDKYFRKDPRIRFHEYFPFSGDEISNNLPSCDYEPSYIIKETIKPDWGITYVYEDLIYPDNYLNFKVNASAIRKLNEKTAEGIAMEYFKSLQNQKRYDMNYLIYYDYHLLQLSCNESFELLLR